MSDHLTWQATGDETEIYAASDDSARPVALVPFHDGQAFEDHIALVRKFAAAPELASAARALLDAMTPPRSRKATEAWDALYAAVRKAEAN